MTVQASVLSASTITGDDIVDPSGDSLGKLEDLMIDTSTGNVRYAVLSFGGFMGVGDKLFAVPMQALKQDSENHRFKLHMDKERLKDAPGFDKDHWPDFADPAFASQVDKFYA